MSPYRHLVRRARPSGVATAFLAAIVAVMGVAPTSVFALEVRHPNAEAHLLEMINCTRTGGWVLKDGTCDGYGSGRYSAYRPPVTLHRGISNDVTRPYARLMAERDVMSHYLGGTDLTERLRRQGYTGWTTIGENIGWAGKKPFPAVLWVHRYMQSEMSWNPPGPHWGNIKKKAFTTVGIGVWRHDGKTYIATDFYTP
jgi:hypothetical protein